MTPPFCCLWCAETVEAGDLMHALLPGYHYACALRQVHGPIAHLQRRCRCFVEGSAEHDPPGITRRQAARLVADYVHQRPGRN